ncbi:saccharopine dehydrogenase family protein [Rummeliibacillus sp. NPDC094406]|uniref:saccharopine dehydrogenase family protein n=1 Tax=Rummeliibacillus sp. NPDC094406 TaxID=3364511 RepID=UPI0037F8BF3C
MQKVMVVGASGVLGRLVCKEVLRIFNNQVTLVVTDYQEERGKKLAKSFNQEVIFQYLDITNKENISRVIKNIDVVVVVLKQQDPDIQRACIDNNINCIDVTPFSDFAKKIQSLYQDSEKNKAGSIVMSGFFPGLSGIMVKKAVSNFQEVTEVNIGLLQNTNAKVGVSGILDMLKIISQDVDYYEDDKIVNLLGFNKKRIMHFEHYNDKEVRLIDHAEKNFLKQKIKVEKINYWTSWNNYFFNKLISLLKNLGIINTIVKLDNNKFLSKIVKHNPSKNEKALITVEVKGTIDNKERIKTLTLSTFSDYHTTAMVTAVLAKVTVHKKLNGIVFPFEIIDLDELLSEINCKDIILKEFIK